MRETLSGMLRFNRREAKPQWWRRYEWMARPPAELVADPRTLGELHRTEREPFKSAPCKRRLSRVRVPMGAFAAVQPLRG